MMCRLMALSAAGSLLVLGAIAAPAKAAVVGPDSFGYVASDAVGYQFQDITGTGARVLVNTDDSTVLADIGFDFNFYGAAYSQAHLSSNGLISFGAANSAFSNADLTRSQIAGGPSIFSYWDDLYTRTSSDPAAGVYYQTVGDPGHRLFIVQEIANAYSASNSASIDFETVLSEADGSILTRYADTSFGNAQDAGASATVGIQKSLAAGQVVQWEFNTPGSVQANTSICYSLADAGCSAPLAVPEPASWSLMILGFGGVGAMIRTRRRCRLARTWPAVES